MSRKNIVVALEGICCSGKTTLIRNLQAALNAAIVPEATTLVSEFPPPSKNVLQARANERFCLQVEVLRYYLTVRFECNAKWILLDRSYLSVLSIAYGYLPYFSNRNGFLALVQECIQLLESDHLAPPTLFLYLDLPVEFIMDPGIWTVRTAKIKSQVSHAQTV